MAQHNELGKKGEQLAVDFLLKNGYEIIERNYRFDKAEVDIIALKAEVVMVVGMRLGCINHALLTAEAIRRDGLKLAGWVANQPGERMSCHAQNVLTLRQLLPAPLLGEVPHLASWDPLEATQYIDIKVLLSK